MNHIMNLNNSPFEKIESGEKTIELRLYDEKRQLIEVGDTIEFVNTSNHERTLKAEVVRLHIYKCFEELYKNLPLLKCGYTKDDIATAKASDMEEYYSKERQDKYGVVGIELSLL